MDNMKRALIFLIGAVGIVIFYSVMMVKLDVVAEQTKARINKLSSDLAWEDFQYQNTVTTIAEMRSGGYLDEVEHEY